MVEDARRTAKRFGELTTKTGSDFYRRPQRTRRKDHRETTRMIVNLAYETRNPELETQNPGFIGPRNTRITRKSDEVFFNH